MKFIDRILQVPSYGWKDQYGELVVPSHRELFAEAFSRINIFKTRRNWISMTSWLMAACMLPFLYLFIFHYFSPWLLGAFVFYAMVVMSTHGTIWYHRYCTHRSYSFSHPIWRVITQNLVVKTFPEEIYVVSHHVHHANSDEPGDPYNAKGGFLYCMLADVNHQSIAEEMSEADYARVSKFLNHTGVHRNSYAQYRKWGSVSSPMYTAIAWAANWVLWGTIFYLIGGGGLVCTMFGAALTWSLGVRNFNYVSHGKGEKEHKHGVDLDRSNLSINQTRSGLVSGEWHNNHHLFPGSARAGFLKHQLDIAWVYIYCMHKLGAVASYRNSKKKFMERYAALAEPDSVIAADL